MSRQYVHLTTDTETAIKVGYRKSTNPVLLAIKAKDAYENGIKFYIGNEYVWLADSVPSEYFIIVSKK